MFLSKHGYGLHSRLCLAFHVPFKTLVMVYVSIETTYAILGLVHIITYMKLPITF
jgi:hypothetical protein